MDWQPWTFMDVHLFTLHKGCNWKLFQLWFSYVSEEKEIFQVIFQIVWWLQFCHWSENTCQCFFFFVLYSWAVLEHVHALEVFIWSCNYIDTCTSWVATLFSWYLHFSASLLTVHKETPALTVRCSHLKKRPPGETCQMHTRFHLCLNEHWRDETHGL